MDSTLKNKRVYVGLRLYFDYDLEKEPQKIMELINKINEVSEKKIKYYNFLFNATAAETKYKKLTEEKITSEIKKDSFFSISFFDKTLSSNSVEEYEINVTIRIEKSGSHMPYIVFVFKENDTLLNALSDIIETTFLSNFVYGFIFIGNNWIEASAQTSLISISEFKSGESNLLFCETELGSFQKNEAEVSTRVFKAYWGNFLNTHHLTTLGGIKKVKTRAPVSIFKSLANGAYLQLTETVSDYWRSGYEKKLRNLDNFFTSIKIKKSSDLKNV